MPKIKRSQKACEQFLIREFVGHLGYGISRPTWQDSPDTLLTLHKGKEKKRVAIEHTEYFHDTVAGRRSPLTPIAEFWKPVQASFSCRISHRKHLSGVKTTVRLKENLQKPRDCDCTELARGLAKELVAFVEDHPVRVSHPLRFTSRDFNGYPCLKSLCSRVRLSRWADSVARTDRVSLRCDNLNTGGIGLNLTYIKTAIANKNNKAKGYNNWGKAEEKWLLIAASGRNLSNHAGPLMGKVSWADPGLLDLCQESPFHRIVFWESTYCWYKWLKPNEPSVQYDNPLRQ